MKNTTDIRKEIESLTRRGIVKPADVVAFAKDPKTALHSQFTWNKSKAAHQWNLEEARRLIRVFVVVGEAKNADPVRAFVSLRRDRAKGGGYRSIAEVRSDADLYAELLNEALADLRTFQKRYSRLIELKPLMKPVAAAIKVIERKVGDESSMQEAA